MTKWRKLQIIVINKIKLDLKNHTFSRKKHYKNTKILLGRMQPPGCGLFRPRVGTRRDFFLGVEKRDRDHVQIRENTEKNPRNFLEAVIFLKVVDFLEA